MVKGNTNKYTDVQKNKYVNIVQVASLGIYTFLYVERSTFMERC